MATITLWTALLTLVAVVVGQDGGQRVSACSTQEIHLSSSSTVHLTSPGSVNTTSSRTRGCKVKIVPDVPNSYVQLRVVSFSLGGQDPCSTTEEHLTISFSENSSDSRGDVDTIRWCGRSYSPTLITKQPMEVQYVPGQGAASSGIFEITLSIAQAVCGTVNMTVGKDPMYIYSPGYPAQYDEKLLDCTWKLTVDYAEYDGSILLDSLRFDLESHAACRYDYLMIDGDKYCGDQRVRVRSGGSSVNVLFVTDHSENGYGFVLRVVKNSKADASCRQKILLDSKPLLLQVPSMDADWGLPSVHCWWLLNAGSDNSVVVLDTNQYHTTASCQQFELRLYDGENSTAPRILYECAPLQAFQTVRSSSRYLYMDIDLGYGRYNVDVTFTAVSAPRDAPPRVLYAGTTASHVWLNLTAPNDLGILIRGTEDDPWNYTTCVELRVKETPASRALLNASDFLYIYSGWNQSFAELGTACGRSSIQRALSYGSKLYLRFKPSNTTLWLTYRLEKYCWPEIINLSSSSSRPQTLHSDIGQDGKYQNNAYCRWVIKPELPYYFTKVNVVESHLHPHGCYDNVTVYDYNMDGWSGQEDKLLEWCAAETPIILSSEGNGLLLDFITNFQSTASGFVLEYSSVSLVDECPSMASSVAGEEPQFLTSPNYPNNYPNNVDCKWLIKSETSAIKLTLLFVSIAQEAAHCMGYDFLVVYDGWHTSSPILVDRCGNGFIESEFISSSNHMLVHFKSDGQNTARGFKLKYQTTEDKASWKCDRRVLVTDEEDEEISSLYYPNPFPSTTDCYWLVMAPTSHIVMLEVVDFDIPSCVLSPVLLYDGESESSLLLARLCGSQVNKRYTSTQNTMYIRFRANGSTSKGFKFNLRSWPRNDGCQGSEAHLLAYPTKKYITSPDYPNDYPPNSNCAWRIETIFSNMTVRLDIEDAKLESSFTCNFDSVSIYDGYGKLSTRLGKFCGNHHATYWSRGLYMYVHFVSDSSTQYRGFRLSYQAVSDPPDELSTKASENTSSIGAVVGGVMGAVIILLVVLTLFLCVWKRCKERGSQSQSCPARQASRGERGSTVFVMSPVIVNQMPPPPYPGLSNAGYVCDDGSPTHPAGHVAPLPPLYTELEPPPPYSETMLESHPPSSPSGSELKEDGTGVFTSPVPQPGRQQGAGVYSSLQTPSGSEHHYHTLASVSHGASPRSQQSLRDEAAYEQRQDQRPSYQHQGPLPQLRDAAPSITPLPQQPPQRQEQRPSFPCRSPPLQQPQPHDAAHSGSPPSQAQEQPNQRASHQRRSPPLQQRGHHPARPHSTSRQSPPSWQQPQDPASSSEPPRRQQQPQQQEDEQAQAHPRALQGRSPAAAEATMQMSEREERGGGADDAGGAMSASYV